MVAVPPAVVGPQKSVTIQPHQVYVRDLNLVADRKDAFQYLSIGHDVLDHNGDEIMVRDLEQKVDPHGTMAPGIRRGQLWRTTPPSKWQAYNYEKGMVPSQPVVDEKSQGT
jgi:hypothetical protein